MGRLDKTNRKGASNDLASLVSFGSNPRKQRRPLSGAAESRNRQQRKPETEKTQKALDCRPIGVRGACSRFGTPEPNRKRQQAPNAFGASWAHFKRFASHGAGSLPEALRRLRPPARKSELIVARAPSAAGQGTRDWPARQGRGLGTEQGALWQKPRESAQLEGSPDCQASPSGKHRERTMFAVNH